MLIYVKGGRVLENLINTSIINLYKSGYLHKIVAIITIISITSIIIKHLKRASIKLLKEINLKGINVNIVSGIVEYGLWIISIVLVLRVIGLTDFSFILGTAFTAVASLIAIKLIYGIVDNIIAGILLVSMDKVKVGQYIRVKEIKGEVINIGVRKTKLKDKQNIIYLIPNKILDEEVLMISKR